jgi:hypothetical protein
MQLGKLAETPTIRVMIKMEYRGSGGQAASARAYDQDRPGRSRIAAFVEENISRPQETPPPFLTCLRVDLYTNL